MKSQDDADLVIAGMIIAGLVGFSLGVIFASNFMLPA